MKRTSQSLPWLLFVFGVAHLVATPVSVEASSAHEASAGSETFSEDESINEFLSGWDGLSSAQRLDAIQQVVSKLEDPEVADGALVALSGFRSVTLRPEERSKLAQGLSHALQRSRDPWILGCMALLLAELDPSEETIQTLQVLLLKWRDGGEEEAGVPVQGILLALGRIGEPAVPVLMGYVETLPAEAMGGLAATRSRNALIILLEAGRSSDPAFRAAALHALGLWDASTLSAQDRAAVNALLAGALQDPDEGIRHSAGEALALMAQAESRKQSAAAQATLHQAIRDRDVLALTRHLKHADPNIRVKSAEALGVIARQDTGLRPDIRDILQRALGDEHVDVRVAIAEALVALENAQVREEIARLAQKEVDQGERAARKRLLNQAEAQGQVGVLIEHLNDEDVFLRSFAAEALRRLALDGVEPAQAKAALLRMVQTDGEAYARLIAASALRAVERTQRTP